VREARLVDPGRDAADQPMAPARVRQSVENLPSPSSAAIVPPFRKAIPGGVCPSCVSSHRRGASTRNPPALPALHSTRIVPSEAAVPIQARA